MLTSRVPPADPLRVEPPPACEELDAPALLLGPAPAELAVPDAEVEVPEGAELEVVELGDAELEVLDVEDGELALAEEDGELALAEEDGELALAEEDGPAEVPELEGPVLESAALDGPELEIAPELDALVSTLVPPDVAPVLTPLLVAPASTLVPPRLALAATPSPPTLAPTPLPPASTPAETPPLSTLAPPPTSRARAGETEPPIDRPTAAASTIFVTMMPPRPLVLGVDQSPNTRPARDVPASALARKAQARALPGSAVAQRVPE